MVNYKIFFLGWFLYYENIWFGVKPQPKICSSYGLEPAYKTIINNKRITINSIIIAIYFLF